MRSAPRKLRQRSPRTNAPSSLQERKTRVSTTGWTQCSSRCRYRTRYRKNASKGPCWGPGLATPEDTRGGRHGAEGHMRLRSLTPLPGSSQARDTSGRRGLFSGGTKGDPEAGGAGPGARKTGGRGSWIPAQPGNRVAAPVGNIAKGRPGGWDTAYRTAPGSSAPAATQVESCARPRLLLTARPRARRAPRARTRTRRRRRIRGAAATRGRGLCARAASSAYN